MNDYKIHEENLKKNNKRNEKFLEMFENWLNEKNLTEKTIRNHIANINLYINDYLSYYEVTKMEDGVFMAYDFLDDWFIRKCLWSSESSIKEMSASIKKFYQCMSEFNIIKTEDYKLLCQEIKDNMNNFIASLREYEQEDEDWF